MTSNLQKTLPASEEMAERLRTWAQRYIVTGAAVGWIHGDESGSASTGVINVNTGVDVTPDTLFQIGSITKVYTTTLIMQLVDEGRVDLDATAVTYLPYLRFADPDLTRNVTIRQLLTHTSGVDGDFFDDFGRGDDTVARYVDACARLPFVFPPGEMWSYANAGFVVLGRIIEVLTEKPWRDALTERLLKPLGLTHTTTLPEEALLHRAAAGHMVDLSRKVTLTPVWSMSPSQAPAGSTPCASVEDLLAFARMHMNHGVAPDGTRVLSEASVNAMQQAQFDLPDPLIGAAHWGLGWMLFDWDGRRVIGHDGGTIGQLSSLRVWPEQRAAIAILTNTSPTGRLLSDRVHRWLFGELGIELPARLKPPEQPAEVDLSLYTGTYERVSARIEVSERDGQLYSQYKNTGALADVNQELPPQLLTPADASSFVGSAVIPGVFEPVRFSGFEDGRPRNLLLGGRVARRVG